MFPKNRCCGKGPASLQARSNDAPSRKASLESSILLKKVEYENKMHWRFLAAKSHMLSWLTGRFNRIVDFFHEYSGLDWTHVSEILELLKVCAVLSLVLQVPYKSTPIV
jgi:hypothetical protein